jgi:hypothetical protein
MNENLSQEEVGILIRGKKILRAKGLPIEADVKSICEAAGVSRKTGYQWADKSRRGGTAKQNEVEHSLRQEIERLKAEHAELEKRYDDIRFENEGRKIAWRIHGVDEFIAGKKNTANSRKKQKR